MHLGFIGFGLIGGSIARAVRVGEASRSWTMAAWTPTGDGPRRAISDGVIDRAAETPEGVLDGADLVVLAGPPTACLETLGSLAGPWNTLLAGSTVITDVASTKDTLRTRADDLRLRYVGGHPMAGLEVSGYAASRADLFVDRPWAIVPGRHAELGDVERVTDLVKACRARSMVMDGPAHDRAVAGISHLPLIVAAALVEAVVSPPSSTQHSDWSIASELAASGWRDMTRLARGDPAMGAGIAVTNATAMSERLRDLQAVLEVWRTQLEDAGGPDEAAILARLRSVRARLDDPS
jgi:prephenate dehydrogenase